MSYVFASKALLPDGWSDNVRFRIDRGRVEGIEKAAKPSSDDTLAGCVIPGLCNAHSHAFQRALAGHTEQRSPSGRDSFWTWRERMYELAGQVDAPALTAIARQVYCEMLSSGYTSVAEFHYLHRDPRHLDKQDAMLQAIVQAATDSGIRLTYIPVLYERAGFNDPEPAEHQRNFAMSLDEFLAHHTRAADYASESVNVGIGAHSLRAVSHESLAEIARVAADHDAPMHLHIAEQQREVDQCMAAYGRRPVRWLLENLGVTERWSLVHATHMDFDETAALAGSGAVAVRLATQSRNVVSLRHSHVGSELFSRVLEGGAMAGGQATVGLAKGAPADLIVLSDDDPMLAGHGDESRLDALVFSGYPLPVERVMVNGDWRVVDAAHVDRARARAEYATMLKALGEAR